jgi:hypothetical protein
MSDSNIRPRLTEEIDQIHDMGFDSRKMNKCLAWSQNTCCDHILGRCNCELCVKMNISFFWFSGKHDEFIIRRILISESDESIDMFIDRSLPDITSSWIWKLDEPESRQKRGKEQNARSNLFCELTIHILSIHPRRIKNKSISLETNIDVQTLDNLENTENVSDSWNIMKRSFFEEEGRRNKRKSCILRTTDSHRA